MPTNVISIFENESLAINASVISDLICLEKFGPDAKFWVDISASGKGLARLTQQVGASPGDTFYTPTPASVMVASFLGGGANASRDRLALSIMGTQWLKIKAKEQNASHMTINAMLIVAT